MSEGRRPAGGPEPSKGPPTSRRFDEARKQVASNPAPELVFDEEELSGMLDDVDAQFDSLVLRHADSPEIEVVASSSGDDELAPVRDLFGQMAGAYVRPVREMMLEVEWGDARKKWIETCLPAIRSVASAAQKLEHVELSAAIEGLTTAMIETQHAPGATIQGEHRELLRARYAALVRVLPQAFALDAERNRREPIIVESLLLRVPGVTRLGIDKMFAAGIARLETLSSAAAGDIAAVTGMQLAVAGRVVRIFLEYREEFDALVPDETYRAEREKLRDLVKELEVFCDDYDHAEKGWSDEDVRRKRKLRQSRTETVLRIAVVLARMGQVERVLDLDRMTYRRKLSELRSFLEAVNAEASLGRRLVR